MIIVNQEILGKNLMTNKFNKFSQININYSDIYTLIYFEKIPIIDNLKLLPNLKKLYIYSNDIMRCVQKSMHKNIRQFIGQIGILENLQFLSVIGYHLQDINDNINCLDNLPFNLEFLEFTMLDYFPITLNNLPINLKEIQIHVKLKLNYDEINNKFNIKYPYNCKLTVIPDFLQYYKYVYSFSISEIRSS